MIFGRCRRVKCTAFGTRSHQAIAPECFHNQQDFHTALLHSANDLKKMILRLCQDDEAERVKNLKLIHFIQEELLQNVEPRTFLIESALLALNTNPKLKNTLELSLEFRKDSLPTTKENLMNPIL